MSAATITARSGGQLVVDQLAIHGVELVFCVPGESYLAVLDALYGARDRIRLINARHEAGAANMAEAYGKLTGRPGVAMVTRGPGACHAAIGVHTALQDSTPMVLLVGQVARRAIDREAFQEVDYRQMFGPLAKWVAQVDQAERVPEYLARAFHVAASGRPGPVVLALPEDMLTDAATVGDAAPYLAIQPAVDPAELSRLRALLEAAERPVLVVGGSRWSDAACAQVQAFAEAWQLPVVAAFRRMDLIDNRSPVYAGDLGIAAVPSLRGRIRDADLVIAVGTRLGDITTQDYTMLEVPRPRTTLVHVYPDADELGRVFRPALGIVAGPTEFAAAVAAHPAPRPDAAARWSAWTRAAHADYVANLEPSPYDGALDMGRALAELRPRLPREAIVVLDAGNHTGWPMRYLSFGRPGRLLGPISGAMGYGAPAAVAASLVHRDRLVVCFVGDGGFLMSGQEIATAVQHRAAPILVVFNNASYGTIRMHQERDYPGRSIATDLVNPSFVALARAYGAH
ncbi:MAG TPA: thiamine pyrophosphate-binding protein, partial [Kofleriaceae bacterium]|nr:thiamine pyrophosphate-binding protein [Kofleriaceae bacterium]